MQAAQDNLVRKQIMLSSNNISKLERIAKDKGTSVAEIVRQAVDNFNPNKNILDIGDQDLVVMVSEKLKEAIKETDRVSSHLKETIKNFEER